MVNIEEIFYQVVKKDLSPDWEDASTKLTDVEVTPSLSYLDLFWIMIKLLIRSNLFLLRYEGSTLILYKELSSPIFRSL